MNVMSDTVTGGQAIASHCSLDPTKEHDPHATRFGKFLQATIKFGGSDLICKTGAAPKIRIRGGLKPLDTDPIGFEEFLEIAKHILTEDQFTDLHKNGSVDFAYDYDESNRFRINLFQARGKLSVAARLITSDILPFNELHLPDAMGEIAMQPQGIVLLAGVTGSPRSEGMRGVRIEARLVVGRAAEVLHARGLRGRDGAVVPRVRRPRRAGRGPADLPG